eukprot:g76208.t1
MGIGGATHLLVLPRFSGTYLLHLTQMNLDLASQLIWRIFRVYAQGFSQRFSTVREQSVSYANQAQAIEDCYKQILHSQAQYTQAAANAKWEMWCGGLSRSDIDRLLEIQRRLRRLAAIGVSIDCVLQSWGNHDDSFDSEEHSKEISSEAFEVMLWFERAHLDMFQLLRATLDGPVGLAQSLAIRNALHKLQAAVFDMRYVQLVLLVHEGKHGLVESPISRTLVTVHFLSLLMNMSTELQDLVAHSDYYLASDVKKNQS